MCYIYLAPVLMVRPLRLALLAPASVSFACVLLFTRQVSWIVVWIMHGLPGPETSSLSKLEYLAALVQVHFSAALELERNAFRPLTPEQYEVALYSWTCKSKLLQFAAFSLGTYHDATDDTFRELVLSRVLYKKQEVAAADAVVTRAAALLGYRWSEWSELVMAARQALGQRWAEPSRPDWVFCAEEWSVLRFLAHGSESVPTGAWALEWSHQEWQDLMDEAYGPVMESEPYHLAGHMEVAQLNESAVVVWAWPFDITRDQSLNGSVAAPEMVSHPFRIQDGDKEPSDWRLVASWEMGHSCLRISIIPEHPLREHHDLSMFSWWILADKQGFLLGGSDQETFTTSPPSQPAASLPVLQPAAGAGIRARVSSKALHSMRALEAFWRAWSVTHILLFLAVMWQQQAWLACCWLAIFAWARHCERDASPLCWSRSQMNLGCYFFARRIVAKFYIPVAWRVTPQLLGMLSARWQGADGTGAIALVLTVLILRDEIQEGRSKKPSSAAASQSCLPKFYSRFRYLCFVLPAWHVLSPLADWLCAAGPGLWGAQEVICLGAVVSLWGLWVRVHLLVSKGKLEENSSLNVPSSLNIPNELHQVGSEGSSQQVWFLWAAQQLLMQLQSRLEGTHDERDSRHTLTRARSPLLHQGGPSHEPVQSFRMWQVYIPPVGGILRMLEVWAALLAQFFLTWLVTYIQGTSYLALGPFDLARLTWRLLSAAWEQFSQCLTTRVGRRLPVGRGEEEPVWSNWLVDATAATLLAGHKASVLLAGGWQRLRRGCSKLTSALSSLLHRQPNRVQPAARRSSLSHIAAIATAAPSRRRQQPQQQQQGRASGRPSSGGKKGGAKKGQGPRAEEARQPQQPGILAAQAQDGQQPGPAPKDQPEPRMGEQASEPRNAAADRAQRVPAACTAAQPSDVRQFGAEAPLPAGQLGVAAEVAAGEPPTPKQRRPSGTSSASEAPLPSDQRQAKGRAQEKRPKSGNAGASGEEQQQQQRQQKQKPSNARPSNPPLAAAQQGEAAPPGQPATAPQQRQHPQQQQQQVAGAGPVLQQLGMASSQPAPIPRPPGMPLGAPILPLPLHLEALEGGAELDAPSAVTAPQTVASSPLQPSPSSSSPRYNLGLIQQQQQQPRQWQPSQQQAAASLAGIEAPAPAAAAPPELAAPATLSAQASGAAVPAPAARAAIPLPVALLEARAPSSPAGDMAGAEEEDGCVVCMEASPEAVLVPCGHLCLCLRCSQSFGPAAKHQLCPVCRERVVQVVQVFKA